ncbi:hypothetical protein [Rhodococcus sp. NBC_00294]|uniref:hypothetical protein n=1 Tax=Rhodococcus sp. NBC_00294 TaxID=2976004 RepID=UPI002E28B233|nr:hypothetical protein [Rhodococcus sp. NBC_00294]
MLDFLDQISGLAILIAAASLAFTTWSHRSNRRLATLQGLTFSTGTTGALTTSGDRTTRRYRPSVSAAGPGVRHGARTVFWRGTRRLDEEWWSQKTCEHFDVASDALEGQVDIPVDQVADVWFGLCWESVVGDGLRTDYVRINLGTEEIQRWRWYWHRAIRLHRWWGAQQTIRVLGGGDRRPMGAWRTVSTGAMREWQLPV